MKRKALLISVAVALVAIMALGVTLAYFTDTKEAKNTFTMGSLSITLDEAQVVKEGDKWKALETRVQANEYTGLYPGAELPKDPTVTNTGANDAYLRVIIELNEKADLQKLFPDESKIADLLTGLKVGTAVDHFTIVQNVAKDNSFGYNVPDDHRWFILDYNGIFKPNDTVTVFSGIKVPDTLTGDDLAILEGLQINVKAYAIQTAGLERTAAFAELEKEFNLKKITNP